MGSIGGNTIHNSGGTRKRRMQYSSSDEWEDAEDDGAVDTSDQAQRIRQIQRENQIKSLEAELQGIEREISDLEYVRLTTHPDPDTVKEYDRRLKQLRWDRNIKGSKLDRLKKEEK